MSEATFEGRITTRHGEKVGEKVGGRNNSQFASRLDVRFDKMQLDPLTPPRETRSPQL